MQPRRLDFQDHRRELDANRYVYAVVSRRSGGLSIGINLNPDKVCNFDCPYCQVDRTTPGGSPEIDVARLTQELERLLIEVQSGQHWTRPPFDTVAESLRRVADIAFAGDGEPTSPAAFPEAATAVRALRDAYVPGVPLRLLTNSTLLHRERVQQGLPDFDALWCKLDAGTAAWFARVDGTSFPFTRVLANLALVAQQRPIVIQSMFVAIGEDEPDDNEVQAWLDRLCTIRDQGGTIAQIQVYTLARPPADASVRALPAERLEAIANRARDAGFDVGIYR